MSRRAAGVALALALLLLLAGLLGWWRLGGGRRTRNGAPPVAGPSAPPVALPVDLYFPAGGATLKIEHRELQTSPAPKEEIRKVVEALLEGPHGPGLESPLPKGVVVGGVQLGADGTAYVDLRWEGHEDPPAGGSGEELQRVYSLVDSIALNVPQARRVVLLWNGSQRLTFSGHLDTSLPLLPSRELLSR